MCISGLINAVVHNTVVCSTSRSRKAASKGMIDTVLDDLITNQNCHFVGPPPVQPRPSVAKRPSFNTGPAPQIQPREARPKQVAYSISCLT